jgi:DNA-binding MarR family transcriptional regulator
MQPSRCNFAALRRAMRRMNALYDEVLAPCGLRSTQYTLMANIGRLDRPAVTQLAEELVMDRSALAHTLQTLQREGLVQVTPDPRDRRTKRVNLTTAGTDRLTRAEGLWREGQDRFEAAIGAGPADDLREMMDRLASVDFAARFKAPVA